MHDWRFSMFFVPKKRRILQNHLLWLQLHGEEEQWKTIRKISIDCPFFGLPIHQFRFIEGQMCRISTLACNFCDLINIYYRKFFSPLFLHLGLCEKSTNNNYCYSEQFFIIIWMMLLLEGCCSIFLKKEIIGMWGKESVAEVWSEWYEILAKENW